MDLQNNVNELITLRTNGVEDAMKSMKDIESLFDRVTSNYRPLLNGERYLVASVESEPTHLAGLSGQRHSSLFQVGW